MKRIKCPHETGVVKYDKDFCRDVAHKCRVWCRGCKHSGYEKDNSAPHVLTKGGYFD